MDKERLAIKPAARLALNQYRLAVLVACAGLLGTSWATNQIRLQSREVSRLELERAAEQQVNALRRELDDVVHPVEALGAFLRAEPQLDQARFNAFAEPILSLNPVVHVLAWAPRVLSEEREAFERGDPALGRPAFGILELDANGARVSAGVRSHYYPVMLAAPQPMNQRLLGFDLAAETAWREALERAGQGETAAATGRVTLLDEGATGGLMVFLPVHRVANPDADGFAIAAIDLQSIGAFGASGVDSSEAVSLEVIDRDGSPSGKTVYRGANRSQTRRYVRSDIIAFGGRQLEVRSYASRAAFANPARTLGTFALGLTMTTLMVAYATVVLGRSVMVEREVALRTRELAEARDRAEKDARAVAELNRALIQRNRELDELLFVTSHDLQEPARKVAFFSDLLAKGLSQDKSNALARELGGLARANERLRALLRDLQALAAIGRSEVTIIPIESNHCADAAINDCAGLIQRSGATIESDEMPVVFANATLLHQVFVHLLQNALKFGRSDLAPAIHITAQRAGTEWVLGVRDNGVGLDPRNADAVFAPFKRLHTGPDNPGTGIGLSLCKKAVERMGGRIWVEPAEGGGAHFRFTVPGPR